MNFFDTILQVGTRNQSVRAFYNRDNANKAVVFSVVPLRTDHLAPRTPKMGTDVFNTLPERIVLKLNRMAAAFDDAPREFADSGER